MATPGGKCGQETSSGDSQQQMDVGYYAGERHQKGKSCKISRERKLDIEGQYGVLIEIGKGGGGNCKFYHPTEGTLNEEAALTGGSQPCNY